MVAPRRVHRPTVPINHLTAQNYQSSNLTTQTPQNEENEWILVIYALRLATKQILRVFCKRLKNPFFSFAWAG
jgi:hypothetical protein